MITRLGCLGAILVFATAVGGQAPKTDQPAKTPTYIEVTLHYAVVIGDGTIDGADKVIPIGPDRHTKSDAEEDEARWKKEHPDSLRLTDVREKRLKVPVYRPSGNKPPELAVPETPAKKPGGGDAATLIRVRVYKLVDGRFVRQATHDFHSADFDKASEYYWKAKTTEGYSATWLDPLGRKPSITGTPKAWIDIEPYNAPKAPVIEKKGAS